MRLKHNKRGQFFILAAIILSAVIISMGITANYAKIKEEPKGFYDYGMQIKQEAGEVINYQIFKGFVTDADLKNFTQLIVVDLRDKDSEANFMFIYGNEDLLIVENYGADVASVATNGPNSPLNPNPSTILPGGNLNIESTISIAGLGTRPIYTDYTSLGGTGASATFDSNVLGDKIEDINVKILGNDFSFPITKEKTSNLFNAKGGRR